MNEQIVLASASPRRKEIMELLKVPFLIEAADIDESVLPNENSRDYVERLAILKAKKVAENPDYYDMFVIGSDVTVEVTGEAIGKAENRDHAETFLRSFSGNIQLVHCGYAIVHQGELIANAVITSQVVFADLSNELINWYLNTNEFEGVAGAYRIQAKGAALVKEFFGPYYVVVGLPITTIVPILIAWKLDLPTNCLTEIETQELAETAAVTSRRSEYLAEFKSQSL